MESSEPNVLLLNKDVLDQLPISNNHVDINLIRCRMRLFGSANKKLLYIGFGDGTNLKYFNDEGFTCAGTELVQKRLELSQRKLPKADLRLVNSNTLPFENNSFDIVIARQSLYYNDHSGYEESLKEILRVLKPGGQFLCSTISDKHSLYNKEFENQEKCILFAIADEDQIRKMFHEFRNLQIGFYSCFLFKNFEHHYLIHCQK